VYFLYKEWVEHYLHYPYTSLWLGAWAQSITYHKNYNPSFETIKHIFSYASKRKTVTPLTRYETSYPDEEVSHAVPATVASKDVTTHHLEKPRHQSSQKSNTPAAM
jgi:hypothetical protein